MKILIVGSGGREHALANAYAKSSRVSKVLVAPGNGFMDFTNKKISVFPYVRIADFQSIYDLAKKEKIDLVDVAQDDPLAAGFVDKFTQKGIAAFGPTQKASQLEWSKEWAREFMTKYNLPVPHFKAFTHQQTAISYVHSLPEQLLFIKASGLALGKGVIRAENKKQAIEAISAMNNFGKSGETFLIEEGLTGEEFTLFAICDGTHYVITKSSQDHKTIYNHDQGLNTGGIGSVAPAGVITPKLLREIEKTIIKPTLLGMQKEGRSYKGILYLGGMVTKNGIKIIEFNARWGDPEAEVILPSIKTDYIDIVEAVIHGTLHKLKITFDKKIRIAVTGCSDGYPQDYSLVTGKEIFGLTEVIKKKNITIFGAGIKRDEKRFFANGGRIFHLVAEGKNISQARKRAYETMSSIFIEGNNLHYRTDIGWRDIERTL